MLFKRRNQAGRDTVRSQFIGGGSVNRQTRQKKQWEDTSGRSIDPSASGLQVERHEHSSLIQGHQTLAKVRYGDEAERARACGGDREFIGARRIG